MSHSEIIRQDNVRKLRKKVFQELEDLKHQKLNLRNREAKLRAFLRRL